MAQVKLSKLSKRFKSVVALDDLTLDAMRERLGVPVRTASTMSEVIGARHLRARASR